MLEFADMSPSYLSRIQLLLLFALLQCVTPLAHAHVNGNHAGQSAHITLNDVSGTLEHQQPFEIARLSTEEHQDAVVCMPPEYRLSVLTIDLPVLASQHVLLPKKEPASHILDDLYHVSLASTPYRHPFSQAPPLYN